MDENEVAETIATYAKQLEKNDLAIRLTALVGITVVGVAFFSYLKTEVKRGL